MSKANSVSKHQAMNAFAKHKRQLRRVMEMYGIKTQSVRVRTGSSSGMPRFTSDALKRNLAARQLRDFDSILASQGLKLAVASGKAIVGFDVDSAMFSDPTSPSSVALQEQAAWCKEVALLPYSHHFSDLNPLVADHGDDEWSGESINHFQD